MPFGSAFTVVTAAETTTNFLRVTLRQTHTFVYGGEPESGSSSAQGAAAAVPQSPAQHEALVQFANALSTVPVMRSAEATTFTSRCPGHGRCDQRLRRLCGTQTSVWRQAITTIMTDSASGVQVEVSMFQSGLNRIDFTARCAAGSHHDLCLRKIKV